MLRNILISLLMLIVVPAHAAGTYMTPEKFIEFSFAGEPPPPKILWLTGKFKPSVKRILGHDYPALRIRYWGRNQKTVWILEEIGKEKPITAGFVINQNQIENVKILIFRESRGDQVRHEFFTEQFKKATLHEGEVLSTTIDGISGATMSVRAITSLSRLALYFHQQTKFSRAELKVANDAN